MGAKRPPAVQEKAYIEIDLKTLRETGEILIKGDPIIAPTITEQVPRGKFEITYTAELFGIMKKMGNKKIEILSYLLDNKDGNNCLNTSVRDIAKATETSHQTVQDTINILKEANLIRREKSVYMLSPNLMLKGNQIREAYLMRKFEEIPDPDEEDIIEAQIEGQMRFNDSGDIIESAVPIPNKPKRGRPRKTQ